MNLRILKVSVAVATVACSFDVRAGNLVSNGDFASLTATGGTNAPDQMVNQPSHGSDGTGNTVGLSGWMIGNAPSGLNYAFVYASGDATAVGASGAPGRDGTIYIWGNGNPSPNSVNGYDGASPTGQNFLASDSDPNYAPSYSQMITGLTIGESYDLTFQWASAQFRNGDGSAFNGAPYSQWNVTLGGSTQSTPSLLETAHGWSGWQSVTFAYTATATSETLNFLATGGPVGAPPVALLSNVSLTAVPEPAAWALTIVGLVGLGGVMRSRRRMATASA